MKLCLYLVEQFPIPIHLASSLVNNLLLCTNFLYFSLKVIETIRTKDLQLQRQKSMDLTIHHTPSMAKNHLLKMTISKWFVQGLKLIKEFHQLADT